MLHMHVLAIVVNRRGRHKIVVNLLSRGGLILVLGGIDSIGVVLECQIVEC